MRAELALLRRKVGWLGCGWMPIPTFGALLVDERNLLVASSYLSL